MHDERPVERHHVGQRHLDRVVMLSDGVFAIAITLSAIELKPELHAGEGLWQAWRTPLLLYFVSFLLTGVIWSLHRRVMGHLRRIDAMGTGLNMVLLSLVALLPVVVRFALAADVGADGFTIYAVGTGGTYLCLALFWFYVAFVARLVPDLDRRVAVAWQMQMVAAPLLIGAVGLYQMGVRHWAWLPGIAAILLLWGRRRLEHAARGTDQAAGAG
jgi:uncharacterized membrane protein